MQIVCVSQGSLVRGREFAEILAEKLGYDLLTRDQVLDMAVDEGIAVGRLETAIVKRRPMDERLMLDNVHITVWHVDSREAAATPSGWGVNLSASMYIEDRWMPFLRAGWADKGGSLLAPIRHWNL